MVNKMNRMDQYAYQVATRPLKEDITALEDGLWVTLEGGKVVVSDGSKKSFMVISSIKDGRKNVAPSGHATYLMGAYEMTTNQFDAGVTYTDMMPLKVGADGKLTDWELGVDDASKIEAYAVGPVVNNELRIIVC